eukprot:779918-Pleurochrysis_carterae.AAC.3
MDVARFPSRSSLLFLAVFPLSRTYRQTALRPELLPFAALPRAPWRRRLSPLGCVSFVLNNGALDATLALLRSPNEALKREALVAAVNLTVCISARIANLAVTHLEAARATTLKPLRQPSPFPSRVHSSCPFLHFFMLAIDNASRAPNEV